MNTFFDRLAPLGSLVGRILLAAIFVGAGASKIGAYAGTQAYMASAGVPGALLPLVIALELGGGLAIVLGLAARPIAVLLAGFSVTASLLFHGGADQMQQIMLMKNFAIAGGLLLLAAYGPGKLSLDARLARQ
ncbi:putative oxidoreductase [Solimonas aquatica]|uniref:Putative oxidoreductase n=1 Tax=Solimonas aquatica TaxID=489703 RepID=A0A1H9LQH5_9GAMM|nr:DoxX family protein [Solimonas aquatica]SER13684.1 putative oxidoreductase [Solimonas aquatica]